MSTKNEPVLKKEEDEAKPGVAETLRTRADDLYGNLKTMSEAEHRIYSRVLHALADALEGKSAPKPTPAPKPKKLKDA